MTQPTKKPTKHRPIAAVRLLMHLEDYCDANSISRDTPIDGVISKLEKSIVDEAKAKTQRPR